MKRRADASSVRRQHIFDFVAKPAKLKKIRPMFKGLFDVLVWKVTVKEPEDDMGGERLDNNNVEY